MTYTAHTLQAVCRYRGEGRSLTWCLSYLRRRGFTLYGSLAILMRAL